MAEKKKGFDLASVLGDVSGSNTETEQIVRIDLDRIDPDPDNFYSLDGLDALAGNIELIGLQQPLRVRPNGERYTIVSGHRRRAAIQLIRDGGSEQFAVGVPCIVEYGEASEAMRKLRLIYANSATRVLNSSELSRQAEEVQRLLYELKEQGVEFPGRMREHVAEACKISASKLARLHAIRKNLDSNLLRYFDSGDLNEDAAYKLSQLPQEIQFDVGQDLVNYRRKKCPSGVVVEAVLRNLKGLQEPMKCRAHAGGPDCHHIEARIVRSIFAQYDWNICVPGKCCVDCRRAAEGCGGACREAKAKLKLNRAAEEEERKTSEQTRKSRNELALIREARRFLPLVEAQGWLDDTKIPGAWMRSLTVAELRAHADGDFKPGALFSWDHELVGTTIQEVKALARSLDCTVDFVLGLSNDPHGKAEKIPDTSSAAAAAPSHQGESKVVDELGDSFIYFAWRFGLPLSNAPGWYAVKVRLAQTDVIVRKVLFWKEDEWWLNDRPDAHPLDDSNSVIAWFELPEDSEDEIEEDEEE